MAQPATCTHRVARAGAARGKVWREQARLLPDGLGAAAAIEPQQTKAARAQSQAPVHAVAGRARATRESLQHQSPDLHFSDTMARAANPTPLPVPVPVPGGESYSGT